MAEPSLSQVLEEEFSNARTSEKQPNASPAQDSGASLQQVLEEAFTNAQYGAAPSASEKRQAIATGIGIGGVSGLTVGSSTVAGIRAGAALPLPPQGRAAAALGGGILGFGTGLVGSGILNELLESQVPERYLNDPRLLPYYQGGRTFGETMGAAPLTFGLPVMQGGRVANFVSRIGTEARLAPKTTAAQELFSATGAGLAGGTALAYDPESEGLRFGAEALGGLLTPPKMLLTAGQNAQGILSSITARFSENARENMAATYLNSVLRETGEDPNKLVNRLLEPLPPGVPSPTSAQKTGSFALSVMETTLAKENPAFGTRLSAQGQRAFLAYQNLVDRMRNVGTPEAFTQAAKMERDMFNGLLKNRLTVAEQDAASRISRIRVDRPETRAAVGRILQEEVENALADAREYEQALWRQAELEAVNIQLGEQGGLDDAVITPRLLRANDSSRGILEAITSVTPEYLRGMPGYGTVQGIMSRLGVNKKAIKAYESGKLTLPYIEQGRVPNEYLTNVKDVPVSYMVKARGDLLSLARVAASSGDVNTARVYNEMAEALMSDMDKLELPAYDRARLYSRELNDTFTRTYARELTASMRTGARKLSPEIIVARAFNSNTDMTAQRMTQVMNSTAYLNNRYERLLNELGADHPQVLELAPFAQRSADSMVSTADAQRQWLLLGANKALEPDPTNPDVLRVNRGKLNTFIAENRRYLQEAGLLSDLENADTAEATLQMVLNQNSAFNKGIKDQAAFAIALGTKPGTRENPVKTVAEAINGRSVRSMQRLSALARSGGRDAVNGFKSILYDYAYTSAGGMRGNFSPTAYYDTLFEPISRGQPSLIQFMTQSGMMTQMEKNNLRRLLLPMVQIENASMNKEQLDAVLQGNLSSVQRLAVRYVGARAGSNLAKGAGSGASIQIPGYVAGALEDLVSRQPNILIKDVLQRAAQDPQLEASLIQRADPNSQTGAELARKLRAQLGLNGIYVAVPAAINPLQYEPPQQQEATGPYSAGPATRAAPAAPPTRGVPGVPAAGSAPAPAPAPGPAGVGGSSREMLQKLFPFDATLSM